jgi:hypothetical protein
MGVNVWVAVAVGVLDAVVVAGGVWDGVTIAAGVLDGVAVPVGVPDGVAGAVTRGRSVPASVADSVRVAAERSVAVRRGGACVTTASAVLVETAALAPVGKVDAVVTVDGASVPAEGAQPAASKRVHTRKQTSFIPAIDLSWDAAPDMPFRFTAPPF